MAAVERGDVYPLRRGSEIYGGIASAMRVLFWSGNFWPLIGGAEVLASKILPALRERGYEFIVVTSQTSLDLPRKTIFQELGDSQKS